MKHTSISPFYVGQEVVCVKDYSTGIVKKGCKYLVYMVRIGCSCGYWVVDVGITNGKMFSHCPYCWEREYAPNALIAASLFAPITSTFQSITLEKVLEEETKLIGVN